MGKGERIIGLDVARVVAILAILLCHWSRSLSWSDAGNFLGTFGNALFFLLSGLGLSVSWHTKGCPTWGGRFMLKRCMRLFPAFWFVLVIGILVHHAYVWPRVILNALGLSWFFKLPGCGYLWFVTAILIFYLLVALLSRFARATRSVGRAIGFSLIGAGLVQFAASTLRIHQAWFVPLLWAAGMAFLFGDVLISWVMRCNPTTVVSIGLLFVLLGGFGLTCWSTVGASLGNWAGVVLSAGVTMISLILPVGPLCGVVTFLGGLTYELYLVHEFFCYTVPLRDVCPSVIAYLLAFLLCSLLAAWILKKMTDLLSFNWKK